MEINDYKEAINFAIDREIEAQNFYKEIANKVSKPELNEMFLSFAGEEKKHEMILKDILKKDDVDTYFHEDRDYGVAETVPAPDISQISTLKDAFALAMKNEEKAMKMYLAMAENCKTRQIKTVFEDLAAMERDHKFKMESSFTDVAFPEAW